MTDEARLFDRHLEPVADPGTEGWAVFEGSDGEDPHFVAFFVDRDWASSFAAGKDGKRLDEPLVFSPDIVPALLTSDLGIVATNDGLRQTHAALAATIEEYREEVAPWSLPALSGAASEAWHVLAKQLAGAMAQLAAMDSGEAREGVAARLLVHAVAFADIHGADVEATVAMVRRAQGRAASGNPEAN